MSDEHSKAEHHHVNYIAIWWWLLILTVGEVGIVYVGLPKSVLAVTLVSMALVKAFLVAAYFMHLKFDSKVLWVIAAAPLIFATIMVIGLVPDSEKGHVDRPEAAVESED